MTELSEVVAWAVDATEGRTAEVGLFGISLAVAGMAAANLTPEGTFANAASAWVFLAGAGLAFFAVLVGSDGEEGCPNCGHDVADYPNYCANCGTPLTDDERESVLETARGAAREEAREVLEEVDA